MAQSYLPDDPSEGLRIDIVSDVVCPWCIIGFKQLERALIRLGQTARIYWHPFELNPEMGPDGQDLRTHVAEKYGSTEEQSEMARLRLTEIGKSLGFHFAYSDSMRMVNTFRAHQLVQWAGQQGVGHQAKMALFKAYFSDARDVSDPEVLIRIAAQIDLDPQEARDVLKSNRLGPAIREEQHFWTSNGIQGVPTMIFNRQHLVTGAQGVDTYAAIIGQLTQSDLE